jgi:hypothetical protein
MKTLTVTINTGVTKEVKGEYNETTKMWSYRVGKALVYWGQAHVEPFIKIPGMSYADAKKHREVITMFVSEFNRLSNEKTAEIPALKFSEGDVITNGKTVYEIVSLSACLDDGVPAVKLFLPNSSRWKIVPIATLESYTKIESVA